jgi:hypothetical protein
MPAGGLETSARTWSIFVAAMITPSGARVDPRWIVTAIAAGLALGLSAANLAYA